MKLFWDLMLDAGLIVLIISLLPEKVAMGLLFVMLVFVLRYKGILR